VKDRRVIWSLLRHIVPLVLLVEMQLSGFIVSVGAKGVGIAVTSGMYWAARNNQ